MTQPTFRRSLPIVLLLSLSACRATDLLYEPKPDDPLDGYAGSLATAGVNTEMDFGPKQEYLLSGYKTLREEHHKLQEEFKKLRAENQNLTSQLGNESELLVRERAQRAQSEALVQKLQQRQRELEARILGLGIEKAKLEQKSLLAEIASLQRELDGFTARPAEAAAAPPAGR